MEGSLKVLIQGLIDIGPQTLTSLSEASGANLQSVAEIVDGLRERDVVTTNSKGQFITSERLATPKPMPPKSELEVNVAKIIFGE